VLHEWPQTIRGPVKHGFGFVCEAVWLRTIRKLVGIVSWYFDYHDATFVKKIWRSNLPKLRHQENSGRRVEGRVSSFDTRTPRNQLTTVADLGVVHYCTVFEINWGSFPNWERVTGASHQHFRSGGRAISDPAALLLDTQIETTDEHLD
jgi:hypothetical protein